MPWNTLVSPGSVFRVDSEEDQPRLLRPARLGHAHLLRLVLAAAFGRDLEVAAAEHRVERAGLDPRRSARCRGGPETHAAIQLQRLPGTEAFLQLLGELRGVGSRLERERCEIARQLVLPVTVGLGAAEPRVDDERPVGADDPHHVAEHLALSPERGGLGAALREPVVERPREELLGPVQGPGLQQLLGPDDAERLEQFGADDVLPALAAVERQVGHPRVVATRHPRHERRVLVVGVGRHEQGARGRRELLDLLEHAGGAEAVDRAHLRRHSGVAAEPRRRSDRHQQQEREGKRKATTPQDHPRSLRHGNPPDSSGFRSYSRPAVVLPRSARALPTMSRTSRISVGPWYGMPSLIVHSTPPPCTLRLFDVHVVPAGFSRRRFSSGLPLTTSRSAW